MKELQTGCCPYCGADTITAYENAYAMDPSSDVILMSCQCRTCNETFTLQYDLTYAFDNADRLIAEVSL